MPFKFEKLEVWKEAVELSGVVYEVASKFPKQEQFVLVTQIQRAADSVSLNIAEGSTGQSSAEFKRFLGFSIRSGIEVVGCIYLAKRRGIISDSDFTNLYEMVDRLTVRIQALRKSIK
ncbi:MAG: four helix bundle protein [Cyclobacteriaceae bacterium]|nr:four helix bundle protein [Cyclobacteriaceae bacterium]